MLRLDFHMFVGFIFYFNSCIKFLFNIFYITSKKVFITRKYNYCHKLRFSKKFIRSIVEIFC